MFRVSGNSKTLFEEYEMGARQAPVDANR